jgi:UPF0755 protein
VKVSGKSSPVFHLLVLLGVTAICLLAATVFTPAGYRDKGFAYVVIEPGASFSEIEGRFADAGLIDNRVLFLVLGRIFGIEHRAKAGRYRFPPQADMAGILHALFRGATYRERVLIRPGKAIPEVAETFQREAGVDSVAFVALAEDSAFLSRLGVPSATAEGFLFPDTYDVEWREAPASLIGRMVRRFFRVFDDSMRIRAAEMGMTITEAVTLASIIEKEAMLDSERPRISAVFHNRLNRGMRLQADPTVRYALRKWSGRILYRDLKVDSPFNTYVAYGLPPHPICNPSAASLVAALYPLAGSKDIYFVAQGDGSHYFSRTAAEHNRAKARYRSHLESLSKADTLSKEDGEADEAVEAPE